MKIMRSAARPNTIGEHFDANGQRTSGFDYMRIVLAMLVLAWHSVAMTHGQSAVDAFMQNPFRAALVSIILPMFFALSGFLVTTSLYRVPSLKVYLTFRGLRLFPALIVEITLSALLLGPILTTVSLQSYFTDTLFFKYFLNLFGIVQYLLPGVFEANPYPNAVNGSLWTLPYELECYIYLAIFFALGVYNSKGAILLIFILLTIVVIQLGFTGTKGILVELKNYIAGAPDFNPNLQEAADGRVSNARIIVLSFFAGSLIYAWRDRISFNWVLAAASAIVSYGLLLSPTYYFFSPLPIAYITVWLGLQTLPRARILQAGDYSYGIYLYAFPIQQTISYSGISSGNYSLHVLLSLFLTTCFAIFSWHAIEKPSLRLKSRFI
jgi:peptidoglycan/LPS O-acetylase OafA/YrhL